MPDPSDEPADKPAGGRPSRALTKLLVSALLDQEFCDRLFVEREVIARKLGVTPDEIDALAGLERHQLDRLAARLRRV